MDPNQNRYAKQIVLPEIGLRGQKSLNNARVLCVGAGGLGSPALLYLAAAGVGDLGIIDGDQVEASNLPRQVLFDESVLGEFKAEAARKRIKGLNPNLQCSAYPFELSLANAHELISQYDLVIDGADNFATTFLINDACTDLKRPWVYAAVNQWEGQVAAFHSPEGPCYRCLFPKAPNQPVGNCAENGILGPTVGIIGSWQALLAIQILLPNFKPKWGRLQIFDALTLNHLTVQIQKSPTCPSCNLHPLQDQPSLASPSSVSRKQISSQDFLNNSGQYQPIDVRTQKEWLKGHIPEAQHWSLSKIEAGGLPIGIISKIKETGKTALLYCQSGIRSKKAAELLEQAGYLGCVELRGGFLAWSASSEQRACPSNQSDSPSS
jgi:molybdopterin/thiamine biosynthesis adenylyltransferase/rhodanese-related sulfurtransferase